MNTAQEINEMKLELGLAEKVFCTTEEKEAIEEWKKEHGTLPEDVFLDDYSGKAFRYKAINREDADKTDLCMLLLYKQLTNLRFIYKLLAIFFVATVIAAIIAVCAVNAGINSLLG